MVYKSKSDQRIAAGRHYDRNKGLMKRRAKAHTNMVREQIRAYVAGYLSGHPCVDCGEKDPIVLEFDHRNRSLKRFNIADGIKRGMALKTVIEEIAKCDVRCANCHRRKTFAESQLLHSSGSKEKNNLPPLPLFDL